MIMRNHGLLSVGRDHRAGVQQHLPPGARLRDAAARMACNAEISTCRPSVIAHSNAQLAVAPSPDAKGRKLPQGSIEWPALKRMLDRRDPSYKT